jgi:murein DD-endopeptidase MepM/ murein hydrolase activator NlpD
MTIRILNCITSLIVFSAAFGQQVIDTIETENGPLLLYSNRTWMYMKDLGFDGVLNRELYNRTVKNPELNFVQTWNNSTCYTSGRKNDMSKIKDTFPIWLLNKEHPNYVHPIKGIVTSRYGYRSGRHHSGIDIDLDVGDTIQSVWDGKVRYAKYNDGGFGNLVVVRHYNGLETFYAHLSKISVVPDQEVKAGDLLGLGGNTGRSFGAHLHFEVRFFDSSINPEEVIDFASFACKDSTLAIHKHLFIPGAKPTDGQDELVETPPVVAEEEINPVENPAAVIVEPSQKKYYKVRSGDTLTEIAARNNTTVSKICQLNGIRPTTALQIGRSLRVK